MMPTKHQKPLIKKWKRKTFMNSILSPCISEFETLEQEISSPVSLGDKGVKSLANPHPPIPYDEVIAEMEILVEQLETEQKKFCCSLLSDCLRPAMIYVRF